MSGCRDCGSLIWGDEIWCEDCFEKGLHRDMNDHFDNFVRGEINEMEQKSLVDFTEELTKRGYDQDAINEINLVARTWFEQKAKPYYFQMTGTDTESGQNGYFISTVPPKMARSNAPLGFVFLID